MFLYIKQYFNIVIELKKRRLKFYIQTNANMSQFSTNLHQLWNFLKDLMLCRLIIEYFIKTKLIFIDTVASPSCQVALLKKNILCNWCNKININIILYIISPCFVNGRQCFLYFACSWRTLNTSTLFSYFSVMTSSEIPVKRFQNISK